MASEMASDRTAQHHAQRDERTRPAWRRAVHTDIHVPLAYNDTTTSLIAKTGARDSRQCQLGPPTDRSFPCDAAAGPRRGRRSSRCRTLYCTGSGTSLRRPVCQYSNVCGKVVAIARHPQRRRHRQHSCLRLCRFWHCRAEEHEQDGVHCARILLAEQHGK